VPNSVYETPKELGDKGMSVLVKTSTHDAETKKDLEIGGASQFEGICTYTPPAATRELGGDMD
jgi:hypothetical protein